MVFYSVLCILKRWSKCFLLRYILKVILTLQGAHSLWIVGGKIERFGILVEFRGAITPILIPVTDLGKRKLLSDGCGQVLPDRYGASMLAHAWWRQWRSPGVWPRWIPHSFSFVFFFYLNVYNYIKIMINRIILY